MSHIHWNGWVPRQNKLEIPRDKDESTTEKSTNAMVSARSRHDGSHESHLVLKMLIATIYLQKWYSFEQKIVDPADYYTV